MDTVDKARWYTLQVMSGQECRVRDLLQIHRQNDLAEGIDHGLREVLLPTQKIRERKNGSIHDRTVRSFPGYVFIRALLYDDNSKIIPENWLFIKETKGVINFMGGERPIPLSEEEVSGLMQVEAEKDTPKVERIWKIGENVIIKEGLFEGSEGTIEAVDDDKQKLKVNIFMFDRWTLCEVDFWQVDRPQ